MKELFEEDGHVPMWPLFIERKFINRTLAYYDSERVELVLENGDRYFVEAPYPRFVQQMFDLNLLLFLNNILDFPHIDVMVEDKKTSVMCSFKEASGTAKPLAARIKGSRNSTRWISQCDSWGGSGAGPELLTHLRETYEHCKVGTPATAGGLGQALMRKAFKQTYGASWKLHRHSRPHSNAQTDILDHMTGGRVDTPGLGRSYPIAIELDMKNGYAAHYEKQPAKTAIRILYGETANCVTWFCHCMVTITEPLPLGPFPVREKQGASSSDLITYPTEPGEYDCWLWKEQSEDAIAVGCKVEIKEGWGWNDWTYDNKAWIELVEKLRDTAPNETVEKFIKLAIVAGIGRHGMRADSYVLVSENEAAPEDVRAASTIDEERGINEIYDWFVHKEEDLRQANQTHWFSYTIMQCARTLYHKELPYAKLRRLIASNYDSILIDGDLPYEEEYPNKKQSKGLPSGVWTKEVLTGVFIPAPRAIESNEKVRRPGVKRKVG
jgi:hypothetical protein